MKNRHFELCPLILKQPRILEKPNWYQQIATDVINEEAFKKDQAAEKQKGREKQRGIDEEELRKKIRTEKQKGRDKQRETDEEESSFRRKEPNSGREN